MSQLRAYHWNGGKVIDLLRYQKKKKEQEERRQEQEERRQEQEELIKELRQRQSGWKYEEQMRGKIPGLEQHSMKWMKDLIHSALNA